jgi:hypothetical protein
LSISLFITTDALHKNIKTIKRSSITSSEIKKLLNIANRIFETFNNMEMGVNISFEDFLLMLNLVLLTYIDSLCNKLTITHPFLENKVKDIRTNVCAIEVAPLWEANNSTIYS